jgi:hypothetical protein
MSEKRYYNPLCMGYSGGAKNKSDESKAPKKIIIKKFEVKGKKKNE